MVIQKRKSIVGKLAASVLRRPAAAKGVVAEEDDVEETKDEVLSKTSPKKGKSPKKPVEEPEEEETEEIEVSEKEKEKQRKEEEKQKDIDRRKELKAMSMDDLKELVTRIGKDPKQKKDELITAVAKHEAKLRAEAAAREAKMRAVVVKKKQELERLSLSDLAKQCASLNIEGAKSKNERVERILKQWQEADGVAKALKEEKHQERHQELLAIDNAGLRKLCEKAGVDPFVKEVVIDRFMKHEAANMEPTAKVEQAAPAKMDLVETLLLKEKEQKEQKEKDEKAQDALAKKKKALKSWSPSDLKQALQDKGLDAEGNKEAMIEAVAKAQMQEDAAKQKKKDLMNMAIHDLKDLLAGKGLNASGNNKGNLVSALLDHEASLLKRQLSVEGKEREAFAAKRAELEAESQSKLKELCASKELSTTGVKEALVGRLLDQARRDGELTRAAAKMLRAQRKEDLSKMDIGAVVGMCDKAGVDPCVKEVMVERLLSYETEEEVQQPPAKRARR